MTTKTPREIDTELAAIWHEIAKAEQQLDYSHHALRSLAGARYYYRGRKRVTDMTVEQAVALVTEAAAYIAAYKAEHSYTEPRSYGEYTGTDWAEYSHPTVMTYDTDKPAQELAKLAEREAKLAELHEAEQALQALYTGWSRFFLVTSSSGHVHSSTHCQTCRPTTTYGWLPQLSGKDEASAVAELGPTLCSVCFASAPTEWTAGKKITAAQAARKAA